MIVVSDHTTLLSYTDSCPDVIACNHATRNVRIEEIPNGWSSTRLELIFEDNQTQESEIAFNLLTAKQAVLSEIQATKSSKHHTASNAGL